VHLGSLQNRPSWHSSQMHWPFSQLHSAQRGDSYSDLHDTTRRGHAPNTEVAARQRDVAQRTAEAARAHTRAIDAAVGR
jgi:hypothetical protein